MTAEVRHNPTDIRPGRPALPCANLLRANVLCATVLTFVWSASPGCGPASGIPWDSPGDSRGDLSEKRDRPSGETNLTAGDGVRSAKGARTGFLGYSASPLYRRDVRTIAVEMFDSREYRRQWEFKITEAVAKRLQLETGWRIVHPSKADTLLTGELITIGAYVLSEQPDSGGIFEFQTSLSIRWRWKDLRTGRILFERTDANPELAYAFNYPQLNEGLNFSLDAAVDGAARKVVESLRKDF